MELKSITFPGLDETYLAAPGGYGYGEGLVSIGSADDDATFTAALSAQFAKTSNKTRQFAFTKGGSAFVGTLWNAGNNYGVLVANSYAEPGVAYRFKQLVRACNNGTWGAWVDNSPTAFAPASHTHEKMKLLWENASPASGFDAQTISLDLSEYQFVLIYFDTHATTGTFKGYYSSTIAKVGKPGLQCNNGEAGTYIITRAFAVTTNGIEFTLAFYAKTYAGELKNTPNCLVPYQIYGIKGVS